MAKRRTYSSEFKAKVALEAIRGDRTISELSSSYGVHPNLIAHWKKHLLESAPAMFARNPEKQQRSEEALRDQLYQEIGKLKVEVEFLKKKSRYEH